MAHAPSDAPPSPTNDRAAEPMECPMCGGTSRETDSVSQETLCSECGLVLEAEPVVAAPPLTTVRPGAEGSGRGIGPFALPGGTRRNLGTVMSIQRDGQGRPLKWQRRYEFQHLRRVMQRQVGRSADGPLERSQARNVIAVAGERLGLPPVVLAESERVFAAAKVRGLFRGRSLPASAGAAVYAACRQYSVPRTLGEVARALGARRSEVGRAFKVVRRGTDQSVPSLGPRAFLARYAEELALSPKVRSTVEAMIEQADENAELSGLSPHGLVAALIYLAAERNGERRTRAQVARVGAVTEVTLRSTSRLVERLLHPREGS